MLFGADKRSPGEGDMPVKRLTARNVRTLPAIEGKRTEYIDQELPGFGLRVTAKGHRSYALTYWKDGQNHRLTIGDAKKITLADARELAEQRHADVVKGANPAAEKKAKRLRG